MLEKALRFVTDLKEKSLDTKIVEHNGHAYYTGNLNRFREDEIEAISLNSLASTVDYIGSLLTEGRVDVPYIVEVSYNKVIVRSGLNEHKEREKLVSTVPMVPTIHFNQYMDMEEFIIMLKTTFVETDNLNRLVALVSQITDESKVEFADDGFGMSVSVKKGVAVKKEETMSINPIVNLKPIRTFPEIDQVASRFLIRVKDGGRIALFEADGGAWRYDAQVVVSEYLRENLDDEIKTGNVIVVG